MTALAFVRAVAVLSTRALGYKRGLDVVLVLLAVPILLPVFAVLALMVRATSRGPAFFIQQRIGRDGVPFGMIKFRSMFVDADSCLAQVLGQNDRDTICFKAKDDPRMTKLGRILRRSSLDELPQFINVLKGEMSLVGPRPALAREVALYPATAMERLAVLPGITGAWQVAGRADLGFDEMLALDLGYVRQAGLWVDLRILGQTIGAVMSGRGAY